MLIIDMKKSKCFTPKFLIFFISVLISGNNFANTWLHFKNQTSDQDAYYLLKENHLAIQNKISGPLRYSIFGEISTEQKEKLQESNLISTINSSEQATIDAQYFSPWKLTKKQRDNWTWAMGISSFSAITLYGLAAWDWGNAKFAFGSEHFFAQDTYAGGADKLGHMFAHYTAKRIAYWTLLNMGWDYTRADIYSALMAFGVGLSVEIGDGLSHYRFSWEDLLFDTSGILLAYFVDHYPWAAQLIDFRLQYFPSSTYRHSDFQKQTDIATDYDGEVFWLGIKTTGIPLLNDYWFTRYFTLDIGYGTTGYANEETTAYRQRHLYYGIGINLSELIFQTNPRSNIIRTSSTLFNFWTPPNTILYHKKEL